MSRIGHAATFCVAGALAILVATDLKAAPLPTTTCDGDGAAAVGAGAVVGAGDAVGGREP